MRVVCWECPDCGHQAHVVWKDTPIACDDCAAEMERMGIVGCVTSVADANTADEKMTENTIELTDRQRERIEQIKDECKEADPGLPRPTDEQIVKSLLDTWDAVDEGLYSTRDRS